MTQPDEHRSRSMLASVRQYLLPGFDLDPEHMQERLRARLGRAEFFALAFSIAALIAFAYISRTQDSTPFDYLVGMEAAKGNYQWYFFAEWAIPFYRFLALLPIQIGFTLLGLMQIAGVWFASRVFNARTPLVLLSYQMLYCLFYGQIVGVVLGGL